MIAESRIVLLNKRVMYENILSNQNNIKYECLALNSMSAENIVTEPLIAMRSMGLSHGLLIIRQLNTVLEDPNVRIIEISSSPIKTVISTVSNSALQPSADIASSSHCQEGQGDNIYAITYVPFSARALQTAGRRRRRRANRRHRTRRPHRGHRGHRGQHKTRKFSKPHLTRRRMRHRQGRLTRHRRRL
jgi:hypothetical protein